MIGRKAIGVVLGIFAVVAMSAAMASSASAAIFELTATACEGTEVGLCWSATATGTLTELNGKQSETVSGGKTVLTVAKVTIECQKASGEGVITQEALKGKKPTISGGVITYKECAITAPTEIKTKCSIPAEKSTTTLAGTLESSTELLLKPETGTVFIEIPFSNASGQTCPAAIKGTHSVTGSQQVTVLNPEVGETTKTGEAVKASKLEFFSEKAELTETLTLSFTGLGDFVFVTNHT